MVLTCVALAVAACKADELANPEDAPGPGEDAEIDMAPIDPNCPDAVGHDEDGDAVDDACDVCPHKVDAGQTDQDGDGVGDVCDSRPLTAGERIVFFDPFTSVRPEWEFFEEPPTIADDKLTTGPRVDYWGMTMPELAGDSYYVFGGRVSSVTDDSNKIGIRFSAGSSSTIPNYYCETRPVGLALTQYDGMGNYSAIATESSTITFDSGAFTVQFLQRQSLECALDYKSSNRHVSGTKPDIADPEVTIFSRSMDLSIDYVLVVEVQP